VPSSDPDPKPIGRRQFRPWLLSLLCALSTSLILTLVAYTQNFDFMPLQALWQPLGFAAFVALLVWLLLLGLLRAPAAAAVIAVVMLLFNAARAPLVSCLPELGLWHAASARLQPSFLLLSLLGMALLALGCHLARRRPAWFDQTLGPLALFIAANLLFAVGRLAVLEGRRVHVLETFKPLPVLRSPTPSLQTLPTVVHLIFDGYARSDILRTRYHHDNTPFVDALGALGFRVFPKARSNYMQTALSLSSLMNLDYIATPSPGHTNLYDRTPLLAQIQSSRVVATLRASGYEIVSFPSGYDFTDKIGADRRVAPRFFNELSANQWERSWLGVLISGDQTESARHIGRIETLFQQLPGICARAKRPQYIFAHVVTPHPPFLFEDSGRRRERLDFDLRDASHRIHSGYSSGDYRRDYLAQLRFVTVQIERLMKRLVEESPRPLVILLHSDHGPGSGLMWESREKSDVEERRAILCALYFSDGRYEDIPDDLSLVNLFRVVFNRYLETDYPLLPNRSYFTRWSCPYQFELIE
jgi:hypothetical protein